MKKELDEALCAKYPKIFADRHKSMMETCMCWGFDHGDGWYNIIDQLCRQIQWRIDQTAEFNERCRKEETLREACRNGNWTEFEATCGHWRKKDYAYFQRKRDEMLEPIPEWLKPKPDIPQVVADQVKEKYGTLRFYYHGGDDYIHGLVAMAEAMTAVTCEHCGAPGKERGGGWIRTLCDEHAQERYKNLEEHDS